MFFDIFDANLNAKIQTYFGNYVLIA